jgi:N-acetylglutamate synthase-like GNAT family acetyltransferase
VATSYSLRPATRADFPWIRRLIRRARINPFGLDWQRFVVAEDDAGNVVGCGQLKPHGRTLVELASIAVDEAHRGRGIARLIIERLLADGPRPLYLTCRSGLRPLYAKWGFRELTLPEMPPYYQRLARVVSILMDNFRDGEHLSVMVLQ